MGLTIRGTNNIPRLVQALQRLGKTSIQVGIFGEDNYTYGNAADLVTIARVHEYGADIKPKKGKWLTIPLIPGAKNKRAGEFDDLFFYQQAGDAHAFLAREKGQGVENVFLLVKSIHIPERSFIRTGFDENVNTIMQTITGLIDSVIALDINPDVFADMVGLEFAGLIQRHARNLSSPPNSPITSTVKRSSNPLNDTGRLIGAIRHKVD